MHSIGNSNCPSLVESKPRVRTQETSSNQDLCRCNKLQIMNNNTTNKIYEIIIVYAYDVSFLWSPKKAKVLDST